MIIPIGRLPLAWLRGRPRGSYFASRNAPENRLLLPTHPCVGRVHSHGKKADKLGLSKYERIKDIVVNLDAIFNFFRYLSLFNQGKNQSIVNFILLHHILS